MENNFRVVIYESSSFGGNYRYAHELIDAYQRNESIDSAKLILPSNSDSSSASAFKILFNDMPKGNRLKKKFAFLLRTFFNPFVFLFWLVRQEKSIVIFNDFDQISSPFWVIWFKIFARKHQYCIVLHDPDRDAYPPNKYISGLTMKCLLWLCRTVLYHQFLPRKNYYVSSRVSFLSVPHGLYTQPKADSLFIEKLNKLNGTYKLMSILGNIRMEKNYEQAIRSLQHLPDYRLLIAGRPANSSVSVESLNAMAFDLNLSDRIIWIVEYLTEEQLAAAIEVTDICLLNYLPSFTSQSGMINIFAPFKKKVIISDIDSGLSVLNRQFKFGEFCNPFDDSSFVSAIHILEDTTVEQNWNHYLDYASWDNHVQIVTSHFS